MPRRQLLTTAKANALDLEGARLFTTSAIRTGTEPGEQIDGGVDITDEAKGWDAGVLRTHLRRGSIRVERGDAPATDGQRRQLLSALEQAPGPAGDDDLQALLDAPEVHESDAGEAVVPPDEDALPNPPETSEPASAAPGHKRTKRKGG